MPRKATQAGALTRIRWHAEAALFDIAAGAVGRLSLRSRLAVGSALGTVFWAVDARHRRAALSNIRLAYGDELSDHQSWQLALASMRHFTRVMVETAAAHRFAADEDAGRIRVEGVEHLRTAHARGLGLLAFTGHFGNWELLRLAAAHHGMASLTIARPLDNPVLDARLTRLRGLRGNRVTPKRGAVLAALSHLRDGGSVSMMIDQRSERSGLEVPFFRCRAFAAATLAVLAIRTGAPIVPCCAVLEPDGSWHVVYEPEVEVARTGELQEDSLRIMTTCTAILERWIRQYPEQWLWTHARLKA
ncbi:MAG: lysophospholipid acyltransferase family protein [Vicinamibacterales bacterium]|nr:lysophospholipid acyltransferase family protein [Vicinamibacterales bacterium]